MPSSFNNYQKIGFWVCFTVVVVAVFVPLAKELANDHFHELFVMDGTTNPSTWYYLVSTLGIYHSYSPIVNTTLGKIRGIVSVSRNGRAFLEFRGIPYAKPPVNDLRFEPPSPSVPWKGLLTANNYGEPCLQFDAMMMGEVLGNEDCLKCHVFTPNVKPKTLMPVIAYIHGGGFTGGEAGIYNPKYILDHDVVVVTFNYRLASLGFLNTGDELIRGNMGLKDQNMALRFIRNNIKKFGGDPTKVTLMGESAGGASVHYHLISPLSRGLFQRAIIQSGNLGSPWSFTRNPKTQALRFGKLLNCSVENTTVLVNCLRKMDPHDIVKIHVEIMSPVHKQDDFFAGSVEAVQRQDTFLEENPYLMLQRGDFAYVPVMFGVNSGDGALKTARLEAYSEILDELETKWNEHIPILLHYDPKRTGVSDKLRDYYFLKSKEAGNKIWINPAADLLNLTKMLGAGLFFEGTNRVAKFHAKFAPTYLYYYTYISESVPSAYPLIKAAMPKRWWDPWGMNIAQGLAMYYADKLMWRSSKDPKRFGACHADDVMQLFSMNSILDIKSISSDYPFSTELVKTIVQFVSHESDLTFNNISWPLINLSDLGIKYMELNQTGGMIDEPFTKDIQFIQSLQIRDPLELNNW